MSNGTERTTDTEPTQAGAAGTEIMPEPGTATASKGSMDDQARAEAETDGAPSPVVDAKELESLKTRAAKADENWALYLRATADLENYRKRAAREKQDAIRFANEGLFTKLLPVLDSFEGALAAATNGAETNADSLREGVSMIQTQLRNALAEAGLEEIDASDTEFDPNFHEAVAQHDSDEVPDGHVLQQHRKGYKYRDRLLRPATVVVARGTTQA